MPKPAITTFSSVAVKPSSTNKDNGLYAPQLTAAQIAAIPANTLVNGAIVYDTDVNLLKSFVNGVLVDVGTGPGVGDVVGPAGANGNNIATFDGNTGKLIQDSGVVIGRVPPLLQNSFNLLAIPTPLVNEIGNLGHVNFINGLGIIFVDGLTPVEFLLNDLGGGDSLVCSLFTGGLPSSSTTPSSLVELQSTTGALLLSRLSQAQINVFPFPTAGMILFNTDTNRLSFYNGTSWLDPASGDSITLTGAVTGTGSGSINTSLATTVECQDRVQIFESPAPDDFFIVGVQNQALLTTIFQIGAATAPPIWLGFNPAADGLVYLECRSNPFWIAQNGSSVFCVDFGGFVGIGTSTPNAPLQFASTLANRKIVFYETVYNDHQFFGFGINNFVLRYQVAATTDNHIFYAATSETTSSELARITGTGDLVVANNIYGRSPSGAIRALGSANTTTVANTAIKIVATTSPVSLNLFSTPVNNRLTYIGTRPITVQTNLNLTLQPPNTLSTEYTVSIFKNGVLVPGSEVAIRTDTPNYYAISTNIFTTMNTNDYIEAFIRSTRAGVMITFFLILSVTTT
jgi:hypothetical protein